MSASEVHAAMKRGHASGLYDSDNRQVNKQPLLEFIVHGLRYAFYASREFLRDAAWLAEP